MSSIGIVAEYNPFHIGHYHQIKEVKSICPHLPIIIIMSGPFVQRGEPALFSKFLRAKWAIQCGADLVIELPSYFALANAEQFARGAIGLMAHLGITHCAFGSEHTDLEDLEKLAHLSENDTVHIHCKKLLQEGMSYGAAFRLAQKEYVNNPALSNWLNKPNVLLGLEYIRSAKKLNHSMTFLPIKRTSNHHEGSLKEPSGSLLRKMICENSIDDALWTTFPVPIREDVKKAIHNGQYVDYNRYEDLLLATSRILSPSSLKKCYDFEEGLENAWAKSALHPSFKELLDSVKSKRYSYNRLRRMAANMLLCRYKKEVEILFQSGPQYGRILAFSSKGQKWLKDFDRPFPLIHRWGQFANRARGLKKQLIQGDMMAQNIQSYTMKNPESRRGGSDFYDTIYINTHLDK